ncbi:MAG: hypothetical protein F9K48_06755 [Candidatus Brocadia sp.]|nr:MAG: hypothetical protein F9K48_06755 [Candidatus Brocadia sp.]
MAHLLFELDLSTTLGTNYRTRASIRPTLSILSVVEQKNNAMPVLSEFAKKERSLSFPLRKLNYG